MGSKAEVLVVDHDENSCEGHESDGALVNDRKSDPLNKSTLEYAKGVTVRANYTIPQPFTLATEKRALGGDRHLAADVLGTGKKTANPVDMLRRTHSNSPLRSRKPLQPDNIMHPDEEMDNSEISSTEASLRTSRARTTVATVPVYRCNERAEKRKEAIEYLQHLEETGKLVVPEQKDVKAKDLAIICISVSLCIEPDPMETTNIEIMKLREWELLPQLFELVNGLVHLTFQILSETGVASMSIDGDDDEDGIASRT